MDAVVAVAIGAWMFWCVFRFRRNDSPKLLDWAMLSALVWLIYAAGKGGGR